jgi:hypothetical protein
MTILMEVMTFEVRQEKPVIPAQAETQSAVLSG